jgi:S-formylglutathione hydrolase FrmB
MNQPRIERDNTEHDTSVRYEHILPSTAAVIIEQKHVLEEARGSVQSNHTGGIQSSAFSLGGIGALSVPLSRPGLFKASLV